MIKYQIRKIFIMPVCSSCLAVSALWFYAEGAGAKDIVLKNSHIQATLLEKNAYAINRIMWKSGGKWLDTSISTVRLTIRYLDAKELAVYSLEAKTHKETRPGIPDLISFTVDSVKQQGTEVVINGHDKHFNYTKTVALDSRSPVIRVRYELSSISESYITQATGVPCFVWDEKGLWQFMPGSRVENGRLCPFTRILNHVASMPRKGLDAPMMNDWFGVWSPDKKQGTIVSFPGSEGVSLVRKKQGFLTVVPPFFSDKYIPTGKSFKQDIAIMPFAGTIDAGVDAMKKTLKVEPLRALRPATSPTARLTGAAKGIVVWSEVPDWKVFYNDAPPRQKTDGIKMSAAKNEYESTQLVFRTAKNLFNFSLRFSDLKNASGKIIPADSLRWRLVDDYSAVVPFGRNGWSGETPDCLLEPEKFACISGKNTRLWLTLKVPKTAEGGNYTGTIEVLQGEKNIPALKMKLQLRVYDFEMTQKRNVTFLPQFSPAYMKRIYGTDKAEKLWNSYVKNLAEHRVSHIYTDYPTFSFKNGDRINVDGYRGFMDRYLDKEYHWGVLSKCFRIGVGHYPKNSSFGPKDQLLSKEWKRRYVAAAKLLRAEMKKGNITERILFNIFDEPREEFYDQTIEAAKLLRKHFPEARVGTYSPYHPNFIGVFNLWQPLYSQRAHLLSKKLKAGGDEIWVYNPDFMSKVDSRAINSRIFFWWMWTAGIDGMLEWAMNWWGEWQQLNFVNRNLSASWIYPGENGPLDSIRWELMREGIEDFEYFFLLAKLLKENRGSLSASEVKEAEKALDDVRAMIVPKGSDGRILEYQLDAVRLRACRNAVAELIEKIVKRGK